jgi:hypothetical protein
VQPNGAGDLRRIPNGGASCCPQARFRGRA